MSHPVWVRGLKLSVDKGKEDVRGVAPRVGAWIETLFEFQNAFVQVVAPRVGAWIETSVERGASLYVWSHPVWVRGLKPTG